MARAQLGSRDPGPNRRVSLRARFSPAAAAAPHAPAHASAATAAPFSKPFANVANVANDAAAGTRSGDWTCRAASSHARGPQHRLGKSVRPSENRRRAHAPFVGVARRRHLPRRRARRARAWRWTRSPRRRRAAPAPARGRAIHVPRCLRPAPRGPRATGGRASTRCWRRRASHGLRRGGVIALLWRAAEAGPSGRRRRRHVVRAPASRCAFEGAEFGEVAGQRAPRAAAGRGRAPAKTLGRRAPSRTGRCRSRSAGAFS